MNNIVSSTVSKFATFAILSSWLLGHAAVPDAAGAGAEHGAGPVVLPLYPEGSLNMPGLVVAEIEENPGTSSAPDRRFRNITCPRLEVFPAREPNGTGVLIMPGGGYTYVVMDKEGRDVATWFNSIGVTAFVLKYRLPNTTMLRLGSDIPLRDARRAMRLARCRAAEFAVRPDRLGAIGFSAGGHLAATLATYFEAGDPHATDPVDRFACRPDFLMLGYPVISMDEKITHAGSRTELLGEKPTADEVRRFSNELQVSSNLPPVFIFLASDDRTVNPENSLRFYSAVRAAGVPVEMHLFESGGHGFALRPGSRAAAAWPGLGASWLREFGFLGAK